MLCQATDGCSRFRDLQFRREWPYFLAVERKCRLARALP
jgi:hypothetical protein